MGSPYYISQCTSRLHSPDKAFAEFQALSLIAESLKHPQRTFLSAFVQQAVDRELAALFFLNKVVGQNKSTVPEFLADWISLLRKSVSLFTCLPNFLFQFNQYARSSVKVSTHLSG